MVRFAWMLVGILLLSVEVTQAEAQDLPSSSAKVARNSVFTLPAFELFAPRCRPCPANPPGPVAEPSAPKTPSELPAPADPQAAQPTPADDLLAGENQAKDVQIANTLVAAGKGLGTAVFDPVQTINKTTILTPLILPGMFTAATPQSAMPLDRVFFNFGYFGAVGVVSSPVFTPGTPVFTPGGPSNPGTVTQTNTVTQKNVNIAGFNLFSFNVGVEKTFLDGLGSVYVSVPLLYASDNITGQQINGLGDVSAGAKIALFQTQNGSIFTAGATVTAPTGHPAVVTSLIEQVDPNDSSKSKLVNSTSTQLNPTFLQPWIAGLLIMDRFYLHDYLGLVIPTDNRIATFINNDLSAGYTIFQATSNRALTSITPTVGAQLLVPLSNAGSPSFGSTTSTQVNTGNNANVPIPAPAAPSTFTFPDQLIITGGVQIGFWNRALFSAGVVTPVVGPNSFSVGATAGINFLY